jgi:hypothetical protein
MKKAFLFLPALLLPQAVFAAPRAHTPSNGTSSTMRVEGKTQIPDGSLAAGQYTIRIVDHLSDRVIVAVSGTDGKDQKFLGVPTHDIPASSAPGPIVIKGADGASALRGFSFAKSNVIEFVYPKNDAVALAKANGFKVLAIDPASDNLTAQTDGGLSHDDMKIVTLWMLTPTAVGAGIEGAKYHPDTTQPAQVAEARKPVVGRLPKTASELPLLELAALFSLLAGIGLTLRRAGAESN